MLQQSGIELVAKNYQTFFRQIDQLERKYQSLTRSQRELARSSDPLDRSTSDLARNYTRLQREADRLERSQRDLGRSSQVAGDSLDKIGQEANESVDSIRSLRDRIKELRTSLEQLDRSEPNFDEQTRELQQLRAELNDYTNSIRATKRATDVAEDSYEALREELNELRKSYRRLSEADRNGIVGRETLGRINTLDTRLRGIDASMGQFQRNVGNYRSAVSGLVETFNLTALVGPAAFAAVGTAVVRFSQQSLAEFEAFETGLREVFTLLPQLGGEGLQQLEQDVRDFSVEVGRTTDQVIPALYQALSAGVPRETVFDFLETASEAARGGVTDLETAVDTLTSVVNAYGQENISVEESSDILFTTIRLGKTDFDELGASIAKVTPVAKAAGVSFDQIGAFLATVTAQGTSTAEAVTQLRSLLSELVDPASEVAKLFERLSGQSFKEFAASGNTLFDALNLIEEGAAATGQQIEALFGRQEAVLAFLQVTGDQAGIAAGNLDEMANSLGATEAAAAQFEDTIAQQRAELTALNDEVQRLTAEALEPYQRTLINVRKAIAENIIESRNETLERRDANSAIQENIDRLEELTGSQTRFGQSQLTSSRAYRDLVRSVNEYADGIERSLQPQNRIGITQRRNEELAVALNQAYDLLANGTAENVDEAFRLATAHDQVATSAENRTSVEAELALKTRESTEANEAERVSLNRLQIQRDEERLAQERSISIADVREAQNDRIARQTQERRDLVAEAAQAVIDENISRETAIDIIEQELGSRERATSAVDAQISSIIENTSAVQLQIDAQEKAQEAIEAAAAADEAAAQKRAELIEATNELKQALDSITESGFASATSIISRLVDAESPEDIQAATQELIDNRSRTVSELLQNQATTFEQSIAIQLAFGDISVDEAELQRAERQFFDIVENIFGSESVIVIDDQPVSIGQIILDNDGAEVAQQITEQIRSLVDSGDGAEVDLTTRIIPILANEGQIDTTEIASVTQRALESVREGATAVEAVELAIEPIVNTDAPIADIQAIAAEVSAVTDEENLIELSTNSEETISDLDEVQNKVNEVDELEPDVEITNNRDSTIEDFDAVQDKVNEVDALEPDVQITSNAPAAQVEVDSLRDSVLSVPLTRTITFNVQQNGSVPSAGFMTGGFTGEGPANQPAGIVHRGEFVIPKSAVDNGLGGVLDFINGNGFFGRLPAEIGLNAGQQVTNVTNNIDNSRQATVNANYQRSQSPATIRDDLSLLDF